MCRRFSILVRGKMSSRFHLLTGALTVRVLAIAGLMFLSAPVLAQSDDEDPEARIARLEGQLRQLTGQNEELQYRNRQLEDQLRQLQGGQGAPGQAPVQPNVAAVP